MKAQPARPPCCGRDPHKWGGSKHRRYMYMDEHCGGPDMLEGPCPSLLETKQVGWHTNLGTGKAYKGRTEYFVQTGRLRLLLPAVWL